MNVILDKTFKVSITSSSLVTPVYILKVNNYKPLLLSSNALFGQQDIYIYNNSFTSHHKCFKFNLKLYIPSLTKSNTIIFSKQRVI